MDIPDDVSRLPPAALLESLERSRADIAAGRTSPLDPFLARMDEKIRLWEASQAKKVANGSKR